VVIGIGRVPSSTGVAARLGRTSQFGFDANQEDDAMPRTRLGQLWSVCAVSIGLWGSVGCALNPATGERQFIALSRSQEIAMGTEAQPQLTEQYGGEVADQIATAYVTEVGQAMAALTEGDYPSLPWEFTLLDSDVINAFALPGGKVFLSRGLAARMRDEAQMAGVIGHEIGHVTARHINDRVVSQMQVQFGATVLQLLLSGTDSGLAQQAGEVIIGTGGQGYLLKFGRDQELQADELGVRYMAAAGYDPEGQIDVMRILAQAAGEQRDLEILSTHPHPETRIDRLVDLVNAEYTGAAMVGDGRFAQRYQQRMLDRVGRIEVSAHDPASWCGICRARLAQASPSTRAQLP
jgi:predicted Zn-dependent protease